MVFGTSDDCLFQESCHRSPAGEHFKWYKSTPFCLLMIIQTNCLTEIFVDRALARAAELDEHLKKTGKVVGILHGLPGEQDNTSNT